jgi:hypothetical protein
VTKKEEIIGIVKFEKEGTRTICLFLSSFWSLDELDSQLDSFLEYYLDNEDWRAKKTNLKITYEMTNPELNYKTTIPFKELIEKNKKGESYDNGF